MKDRCTIHSTKRAVQRHWVETTITCRPFVSDRPSRTVDGMMRNFSSRGAYIEAFRPFKPGTILIVRMIRYPSMPLSVDDADRPLSICLAEVKWLQELTEKTPVRYGMGMRYLM
jgi:hypothetical protein